jgi:hypothetical protein
MTYSMYLLLTLASAGCDDHEGTAETTQDLTDVLDPALGHVRDLVEQLRQGPLSPHAAVQFEKDLQQATRELGRVVVQWTYNHLEPADKDACPPFVYAEGSRLRRLAKKTPQQVDTSFGTITVRRLG